MNTTEFANIPDISRAYDAVIASWKHSLANPPAGLRGLVEDLHDSNVATVATHHAQRIAQDYTDVVLVGSGGSSLSGDVWRQFTPTSKIRLHVLSSPDPDGFAALIDTLPLAKTHLLAISKSGQTSETLALLLAWVTLLRDQSLDASRAITLIAQQGDHPFSRLAAHLQCAFIAHPEQVGGRFSIFSIVGLLPACLLGLNSERITAQARSVFDTMMDANSFEQSPALQSAAALFAAARAGCTQSVMLPYGQRLRGLSWWYRQIIAESLGKEGKGITPLFSSGPDDQHSQLQLYLDGPRDKLFSLILAPHAAQGITMDMKAAQAAGHAEYGARHVGDVLHAQQEAVLQTLSSHQLPLRIFRLGALDEGQVSQLLAQLMLETLMLAAAWNINAFDQPAVEESKCRARDIFASLPEASS